MPYSDEIESDKYKRLCHSTTPLIVKVKFT